MKVIKSNRKLLTAEMLNRSWEPDSEKALCSPSAGCLKLLCELLASSTFRLYREDGLVELIHRKECDDLAPTVINANVVSESEMCQLLQIGLPLSPHVCSSLAALHEHWEADQICGRRDRDRFVRAQLGPLLDSMSVALHHAAMNFKDMVLRLHDYELPCD